MKQVHWGILGCGNIAAAFAGDCQLIKNAIVLAAASRKKEKAEGFCRKFDISRAYGSYEELLADPEVDAVYIAVPHSYHKEWSLKAMQAEKAVLCEKPLTLNLSHSTQLFEAADQQKQLLVEAWWTFYFPLVKRLKSWKTSGILGRLMHSEIQFCAELEKLPNPRILQPELGGGALLDIGIYPLAMALLIHDKEPEQYSTQWLQAETGVDLEESILLKFPEGDSSSLYASFRYNSPHTARFYFEKGWVELIDFFHPKKMMLHLYEGVTVPVDALQGCSVIDNPLAPSGLNYLLSDDYSGQGYQYEIEEVSKAFLEKSDTPLYPKTRTLQVMKWMDRFRKDWGLNYPGE